MVPSRTFFLLLFAFAATTGANAQPADLTSKRIRFEQFPDDLNLSQNSINCLLQDHNGFLWIGTWSGLIQYNGYTSTVYHAGYQSGNLKSNQISALFEDSKNNLWVGTIRGGLYLYKQDQKRFIQFASTGRSNSLLNDNVRAIQEDSEGNLWVGTEGGLSVLPRGDTIFRSFVSDHSANGLPHSTVSDLMLSSSGKLWIGTGAGLCELMPGSSVEKSNFKTYTYVEDEQNFSFHNWVIKITEFKYQAESTIWFATTKGLKQLKDGKIENFLPNPSVRNKNIILTILPGEFDKPYLLVGSDNGLFIFDPINRRSRRILTSDNAEVNLSNNSISSLCLDRSGVLWVGTKKGLNKFNTYLNDFHAVPTESFDPTGSVITGIQASSGEGYWISTSTGGLFRYRKGKFERFKFAKIGNDELGADIHAMFRDSRGRIWIGTAGLGVFCFEDTNINGGVIRQFLHFHEQGTQKLSHDYVMSFAEDKIGNVWVGTWSYGLNVISPKDESSAVDVGLDGKPIVTMLVDHLGILWIGTRGNGLFHLDPTDLSDNSLKHFQNPNQHETFTDNFINSLFEDDKGKLWIGTESGLKVFERHSATFRNMKVPGMGNNVVVSFLQDEQGRFWIANWDGIHIYNPEMPNVIKHYERHDEIMGGFFYNNVCLKDDSGNLLFGGSEGLNLINPSRLIQAPITRTVHIEKFSISHQEIEPGLKYHDKVILPKPINEVGTVSLDHNQNSISFDFTALEFASPQKIRYAYKLDGFEEHWNSTSAARRFATYANLTPGSYTFRVKASNDDGQWSGAITSVNIVVASPWWETIWAKMLYAIVALGILYVLARFLLFRANLLHNLKLERIQRENMEKLNHAKLQFFTNISHEFRTPLTLIIGPLQSILKELPVGSRIHHQARLANENSQRLLRLINQLLDFRKVETENMKCAVSEGNIVQFIREIVQSFEPMAEDCKILLSLETLHNVNLWFDRDKCEKIFFNLISNAFKHTAKGGKIVVSIEELEQQVLISVWDNGHGIKKAHMDNIFQTFFSFDETKNQASTGIGLALVKSLVELQHGSIKVESEENSFSRFSVTLRKGKAHFTEDEFVEVAKTLPRQDEKETVLYENASELPEPTKQTKLLIVDDNEDMRVYIGSVFDSPYQVICASDGNEGLTLAKDQMPDVIIADVMMPNLNGIDMCKHLKNDSRTSHIPVVMLTARGSLDVKLEGLQSGADEYVTKPFNPTVLQLKVRNLLKRRNVLHDYFREHDTVSLEPKRIPSVSPDDEFLKKALDIVEVNMSKGSYTVEDMSHDIGMSHTQLYRKIKALTGQTINDFIRGIRLKRAAQLLEQRQLTVSEITYKVGFTDLQHFRECFKKMYGVTPSQYAQKFSEH